MNKDFTLYPEALELKQLEFDEPCFKFYIETGELIPASYSKEGTVYPSNSDLLPEWTASPTYSQAFRWFRKEYALESYIRANLCVDVPKTYQFNIDDNIDDVWYDTYEEAELACLKKLIEIVKNGK